MLHYGSSNKNTSSDNRKSHYSEERSRDSTNSSDSTGDNLSFYHHFSNTISTNVTGKLSESAELSQQYSRIEIDQQKTKIDEKQKQNLLKKQKILIHQTGNSPENVPETAICNEPESKSSECNRLESFSAKTAHLMRATENELTEQELSNLPKVSKSSKFSEVEITSTSLNSPKLHKNSCSSDVQPNLQHYRCNSKLSSPDNTTQAKQKIIEAISQQRPENKQYMDNIHQRNNADGIKEILDDLDNALESDEHLSVRQIQHNLQKNVSVSDDLLDDSKLPTCEYDSVQSAYKSKDNKGEYEIKSNKIKTTISITNHLNDQLIQELKQLPKGMMSLKDYKQKQKNLIIEQQKLLEIDIEEMKKACTPDKYINQMPEFITGTNKPLPLWRRQMLAQKIAKEDIQKKEEELRSKDCYRIESATYYILHSKSSRGTFIHPFFGNKFFDERKSCIAPLLRLALPQIVQLFLFIYFAINLEIRGRYLTTTEWKETYGGHKDDTGRRMQRALFKRLPITHCSLSLLPFEDPVCSQDGIIFDLTQIIPYLKKYGVNPVTGKKMAAKELIHLKFDKDSDGNFRCPVTFRVFTPTSHIVTICQTGNVYSLEAIEELNLKPGHLKDLLTDEPFQRKDIIVLQDPNHLEKFNIEQFHHIKLDLKTKSEIEAEKKAMKDPKFYIRRMNNETKEILKKLEKEYIPTKIEQIEEETVDELNAAHYSQGRVAAGLTSTTMEPITHQKAAILDADTVKYARVNKNGYVRILTNYGAINLELFCKDAPRACENFIKHCKNGYYNKTKFHRIIRNFIMQGGDPTGTGKGGDSIWGKPFKDEIISSLSHDQRGILSMANQGTDTNKSQFFITFRSCSYLDGKHTIFGRVVGGTETLNAIEKIETDESSRPIAKTVVSAPAVITQIPKPKKYGSGVGKYINLPEVTAATKRTANDIAEFGTVKKTVQSNRIFGDFSSW
ncbi:unnamed protein product [Onchocerca ochengi]|uniref:RING-type E3 ubiquitin-protein ligase PPIL2 n=1 Tax=Onchocerca ochengi TaxID=42157 RepID=A0A3P6V3T9_ONCOC|nr:unnamed protein product [Onchocerca ochengi]